MIQLGQGMAHGLDVGVDRIYRVTLEADLVDLADLVVVVLFSPMLLMIPRCAVGSAKWKNVGDDFNTVYDKIGTHVFGEYAELNSQLNLRR